MSSEDTTKKFDTQPGVDAILERINAFDEKLSTRFDTIEAELRVINKQLEVLAKDVLDLRAGYRILDDRITVLERKPA
ncbi:MAG TPA: hypothetical protein VNO70_16765 [Blastocatellia bacterium]|nr:hypothetical protein [Blastocatellia bacterium]